MKGGVEQLQVSPVAMSPEMIPPAGTPRTIAPSRAVTRSRQSAWPRNLFVAALAVTLACLWYLSQYNVVTPKEGAGYWIGIAGASTLLFQLAYPLRKRWSGARRLGSTPQWFRLHMVLGLLGPLLILAHSNFSLGATNSNIALLAMLTVVMSGLIGRYLIGKTRRSISQSRAELDGLLAAMTSALKDVEHALDSRSPSTSLRLIAFAESRLAGNGGPASQLLRTIWLSISLPFIRQSLWRDVRACIQCNASLNGHTTASEGPLPNRQA